MEKTVDYYMNLPYTRELIREPSGIWFVRIKELPNCMSQGNSPEEAMRMIDDAMRGWLEVELEDGETIPEPKEDEEYSGKFVVRVPRSLHRKLAEASDADDVSLNQWISTALAEAVGSKPVQPQQKTLPQMDLQRFSGAAHRILCNMNVGESQGSFQEEAVAEILDQCLEQAISACEHGDDELALASLKPLLDLLNEEKSSSPLMHSLYLLVSSQYWVLGQNHDIHQKQMESEAIIQHISAMVGMVKPSEVSPQPMTEQSATANVDNIKETKFAKISKDWGSD